MRANVLWRLLLLVLLVHCQEVWAEDVNQKLPVMTGKVIFADGEFSGYRGPRAGDTMKLDLSALDGVTNQIKFERKKSRDSFPPYIPLLVPLRFERMGRDANGQLYLARLISGSTNRDETERVMIDIQRWGKTGRAWIVEESDGIVMSVARLDCKFSDK